MAGFDQAKLYGGRTKISFPSDQPGVSIDVWAHHPTPEEVAAAFRSAGVVLTDAGGFSTTDGGDHLDMAPAMARTYVEMAWLCIDSVENLDGWPAQPRTQYPDGLERLTLEARALIPRVAARKVGDQLWQASRVSDAEGNDSGPPPTGPSSETSGDSPTTAPSAQAAPN